MKTYASHKKYQFWAMSFIIFLLLAAFPVAVTAISISAIVQDTIDTVTEFGPSAIGQTFEVNEPIEVTGIDVYLGSNDEANLMTLALYQGTFDDTDQPTGGGSVVATANVTLDSVASAWVNFNLTASIESGLPYYFIVTSEAGKSLEHGYASTDEYPNGWFLGEEYQPGELHDYPDLDLSFKIYYLDDSQDEPVLPGRHEVITLLVNPQDVSGIRTENLN